MIKLCAFSDEAGASLREQTEALHRGGIHLTELRSIDGVNVKDFTAEKSREYKKILDENGIGVWSIGSPVGKVDISIDFNAYLDTVRRVCETANIFCCDKIRMFSFFNAYNEREKVMEYLCRLVEIAGEYGVTLCHENEKEVYGDTVARVLDIYENVKGIKLVYDPANYVQVGENIDTALEKLFYKTSYFHIKDVIKSSGELVPAGEGDGEIEKLISKIEKDTVLTLEPHLALFEGYSGIDHTEMKNKYKFASNAESFDFAVGALDSVLKKCGYIKKGEGYIKQ